MVRPTATILLLIALLPLSMGSIQLLHLSHGHGPCFGDGHSHESEHEHHDSDGEDCQACYFLKIASTAVVSHASAQIDCGDLTPKLFALHEAPPLRHDRIGSVAPRAPPVA